MKSVCYILARKNKNYIVIQVIYKKIFPANLPHRDDCTNKVKKLNEKNTNDFPNYLKKYNMKCFQMQANSNEISLQI